MGLLDFINRFRSIEPCRRCGGEGDIKSEFEYGEHGRFYSVSRIVCRDCGAKTEAKGGVPLAIELWNNGEYE